MSDGSTVIVKRQNTREIFEQHQTALYPRKMSDHKDYKVLQEELGSNYSMIDKILPISLAEHARQFSKIDEFQLKNTYERIVEKDIN